MSSILYSYTYTYLLTRKFPKMIFICQIANVFEAENLQYSQVPSLFSFLSFTKKIS